MIDWEQIAVVGLAAVSAAALLAAVLAYAVRQKRMAAQEHRAESARSEAAGDIRDLMAQMESLAGQIDRRIDQRLEEMARTIAQADARIAEMNRQMAQQDEASHVSISLNQATGSEVQRLAEEGKDSIEIARLLRMNVGEVELILNLQHSRHASSA